MTQDNPTVKLSDKQRRVIKLMREGMRVWQREGYNSYIATSQNTINISFPTIWKLEELGLVKKNGLHFPATDFNLTELGRTIKL